MITEDLKLFRTVCFITLMQHGSGLISKHPAYICEKEKSLSDPWIGWNVLDSASKKIVLDWAEKFNFPLEDCLTEISKEPRP